MQLIHKDINDLQKIIKDMGISLDMCTKTIGTLQNQNVTEIDGDDRAKLVYTIISNMRKNTIQLLTISLMTSQSQSVLDLLSGLINRCETIIILMAHKIK